jgi:hypothetical protein
VSFLHQFLDKLTRLKRGVTKYGKARHKPVFLLAFIDLIEKGILTQNYVYVDADLVGAFLENWGRPVDFQRENARPGGGSWTDWTNGRMIKILFS